MEVILFPMELILTVVRYQNRPAQPTLTSRIGITGGTIGRNPDNELALPDPERWVGRQHARISFREGAFFLTDTSTNGTFVNKATEAPHKGQEVELHDGDTLSIGSYEIRVTRETAQPQPAASVAPLTGGRPEFESYAQTPSGGAVPDIMDLVGGTSTATNLFSSPAAKQETPAGSDDWLMPAPPEAGPRTPGPERDSPRAPATATEPDHTPDLNAFYSPPDAIPEDYDVWADTSRPQSGAQNLPTGGPESSPAPTAPKPTPREGRPTSPPPLRERTQEIRPTPTAAGETNALQAFFHFLFRPSRGFLPPLEATREAFDDIQCHEMALVAGLRAAFHALLKRMDPAELEHRLRGHSFIDNLMPMAHKAKYWDLFTETYQAISADAADDFMNLSRDAFTRAYEDQTARLRQGQVPRQNTALETDAIKLVADRLSWSVRMRKRKRRIARICANLFVRIRAIRRFSPFSLIGNA